MTTGTITDGGSANSDVVPASDTPLENVPPKHHMEKPSSLEHYVRRSGVPARAKQHYVAARKQAGLETVTTFWVCMPRTEECALASADRGGCLCTRPGE